MKISEQIDALKTMGINATSYLVLPRVIASIISYPILVALSIGVCIVGGYLAGVYGGVISPADYEYGIRNGFIPFSLPFALIKTIVFAFLISTISCYKGFNVSGGAFEVGKISTEAVTKSCVAILCSDYLLAELLL